MNQLPQPVKAESVRGGPGGTGILKLLEDSRVGVRTADRDFGSTAQEFGAFILKLWLGSHQKDSTHLFSLSLPSAYCIPGAIWALGPSREQTRPVQWEGL